MAINLKTVGEAFVRMHFWLLFAGFFFYQIAIAHQLIPPFLGGFFGPVAALGFPLLVAAYWCSHGSLVDKHSFVDGIFALIVIITLFISIFSYVTGVNDSRELLVWSLSGLLFNVTGYMLAVSVNLSGTLFRRVLLISLIAMCVVILVSAPGGRFDLTELANNQETVASYQSIARSLVVLGLLAFALETRPRVRAILFVLTLAASFVNGARTETVAYVASIAVFASFVSLSSSVAMFFGAAAAIMSALLLSFLYNDIIAALPQTRMLELLDIWNSSSGEERSHLSRLGLELIARSPVLGDYGAYLEYGGVGSYPHNILSAWLNLGVAGFLLYILALVVINYGTLRRVVGNPSVGPEWTLACLFATFVTLSLITAKDYSFMLFGMALGFYSRAMFSTDVLLGAAVGELRPEHGG